MHCLIEFLDNADKSILIFVRRDIEANALIDVLEQANHL